MLNLDELLASFLRIGLFSFGGGYAALPLIAAEASRQHWYTPGQFANIVALSQMIPGPLLCNITALIGLQQGGVVGALLALLCVMLPATLIMLLLTRYYQVLHRHAIFRRLIRGFYPVLVALLASATIFFARSSSISWQVVLIATISLAAMATRRLNPFWILLGAALLGLLAF